MRLTGIDAVRRRSKLDRERQAVEPAADLHHRFTLSQHVERSLTARARSANSATASARIAVDKHPRPQARSMASAKIASPPGAPAAPAGDQHVHAGQRPSRLRTRPAAASRTCSQLSSTSSSRLSPSASANVSSTLRLASALHAHHGRHLRARPPRRDRGCQLDQPHPVCEHRDHPRHELGREPRLADASGADDRHEATRDGYSSSSSMTSSRRSTNSVACSGTL